LGREWFASGMTQLIDKLGAYLDDWGIKPAAHLLVIDNTETMASNDEELAMLARGILQLTRRVGRVLLTTRRREKIEARPIELIPLGLDESISLLRSRAQDLNRKPLLQAGDAALRRIATRLGNRPLVLEVFIRSLRDDSIGLNQALDRVVQMQRQDLGEFL